MSAKKVLITGISGKVGRLVAQALVEHGDQVIGIDRRPWPDAPKSVPVYPVDIRKRRAEEIFRKHRPDTLIHMATVTHFSSRRVQERGRINLEGTRKVIDHAHSYGVKQAIFVGRHTYYGAAADSPLYHTETEPPLAITTFPDLADLVAADLYASQALWRFPEMRLSVLRICYTLGPSRSGTLASFLRGPRVPTIPGFDPLFQLMHEADAARAIVAALCHDLRGIYNVAGPPPVPLSLLIEVTGRQRTPIPQRLLPRMLGRLGLPRLPAGAIPHLKYPVVIDDAPFRELTAFTPDFDEATTMESYRWA